MKNTENKANLLIEEIKKNESNRKITLVLSESKAEKCSPSKVEEIRILFNNNPIVKHMFKNNINASLKSVFPKHYYDKDEYGQGEMAGIYDLETEGRSVINKLNTNYNSFCILLRDVNKVLKSMNKPLISFEGISNFEQINQVKLLNNVIDKYKERIFDTHSSTFQSLMMVLGQTHAWGQKTEDTTIEILKKEFGKDNVKSVGKLGSTEDAIGGVDCEVIVDGELKTAQIKPFTGVLTKDENIIVWGSGNVKPYKTDWLIFTKNNREVLVFDNEKYKIIDGNFVFPKESLIYTLS